MTCLYEILTLVSSVEVMMVTSVGSEGNWARLNVASRAGTKKTTRILNFEYLNAWSGLESRLITV